MPTTISIPDGITELAHAEARRRGISLSAVIRESLESSLRKPAVLLWQGIVNDPTCAARSLHATPADGWADEVLRAFARHRGQPFELHP